MFRESIEGMERILETDIPRGSVVLVTGSEGTLKSGLVFAIISGYLASSDGQGLYATLEQDERSHVSNMRSLGLNISDDLHVFDYRDMRREWRDQEPDMIDVTKEVVDYYLDKYPKLTVYALDSLNALYALSDPTNLRRDIYNFFSFLKERSLTTFLILETLPEDGGPWSNYIKGPEAFLADGVIELGIIEDNEGVKRYIQMKKMRATRHRMEKHQIMVGDDGLFILGPIF